VAVEAKIYFIKCQKLVIGFAVLFIPDIFCSNPRSVIGNSTYSDKTKTALLAPSGYNLYEEQNPLPD
jgi:hypothetical protein